MSKAGEYDIDKVKRTVSELERLLADKIQFDTYSADLIIRNLVAGLKSAVQTIEFMRDELEFDTRSAMSKGVKSDAKH